MPCIFGFGFHIGFCPCDLLMTDELHLLDVVCPNCKRRLRCEYNAILNDKEVIGGWDDFDDFVYSRLNRQLHEICVSYPQSCAYGLTKTESKTVGEKFGKVCDQFMTYGCLSAIYIKLLETSAYNGNWIGPEKDKKVFHSILIIDHIGE
jgi:hypothetical protein